MLTSRELLSDSSENLSPGVRSFVRENIGDFTGVRSVSEGYAHRVFRIVNTDNLSFYLKIRGTSYAQIPTLKLNPVDIKFEKTALDICSGAVPDVFPAVVGFSDEHHALLMTDVLPEGNTLEVAYEQGRVGSFEIGKIGETFGRVHEALNSVPQPIREGGDFSQYARNLKHKITKFNDPRLDALAIHLTSLDSRQLIFGDLHPRNIGLRSNNQISFFDLEQMHRGNIEFDLGFVIAHINLHAKDANSFTQLERVFIENYLKTNPTVVLNDNVIKKVSAGIIFYRLLNIGIPYYSYPDNNRQIELLQEADRDLDLTS